ncbi:MAG TPA: ABC transporter permease [Candidatus Sulfotelmatobacter sp.]|nr:ABC transporter permease [Candidatus Sulfotelmatobacter sp.]
MKSPWNSRDKRKQDLDTEIQSHLEMSARDREARGEPADQAAASARRELGNPALVRDVTHDQWRWGWLEALWQDIRFGARLLRKTPVITAVALLSLALGIGANTAIFSLLDSVMLRMLPVQNPEQLVSLGMRSPKQGSGVGNSYTNPIWEQLRDHQNVFAGVLAWFPEEFNLANGGEVQNVNGLYTSGGYFTTLGVQPLLGRLFNPSDDTRACGGAAILGYGFWQQHYGGAASAIGSQIQLDGHSFPVIGVTPPNFFGTDVGRRFDVAVPICAQAVINDKNSFLDERAAWWLRVMARQRPGQTREQTDAGLAVLAPQIFAATVPPNWKPEMQRNFLKRTFVQVPAGTGLSGLRRQYERPLEMLMVIVALVLLIACANIASLFLARAASRQKEIAVRLSLGASRTRLIRQVLTESILLSAAGALLGILFAKWGGVLLVRFVSTKQTQVFLDLSMDLRVLSFTVGIAILTGLLFGILPAFRSTRVSLTSAIKGVEVQGDTKRSRFHSGKWIVALQVALSLILLVGTGLFVRSFRNLITLDPGFDRQNVLLVTTRIHDANIAPSAHAEFYGQILARLKAVPGVTSASQDWMAPMSGVEWNEDIAVEGQKPAAGEEPLVWFNWITPDYFATLRTPVIAGRVFDARDTANSQPVAIVNETMARKFFPNKNPIGQYFHIPDSHLASAQPLQIVGLVKDSKYDSLREDFFPFAYVPLAQMSQLPESGVFELRTGVTPSALIPAVRDAIGNLNKGVSLQFTTLSQSVDDTLAQERLLATLSGFFGGLALLLTAIGLYGVMSYVVTQRTREIGIRMALGAQPASIMSLVMRDAAALLAVGIAAGVVASIWVARLVQQLLFGLKANDAETLALAAGSLVVIALLASYLPARRAMRVDPIKALHYE